MSDVETGQMSAAETGQISTAETKHVYSIETGQRLAAVMSSVPESSGFAKASGALQVAPAGD